MSNTAKQASIRTLIPARLDRLRWNPFHTRMVAGLRAAWVLDGLQITEARESPGVSPRAVGSPSSAPWTPLPQRP